MVEAIRTENGVSNSEDRSLTVAARGVLVAVLLVAILGVGGFLRFYRIDRQSLWFDEIYTVYLASGRGSQAFELPVNRLLDPPPKILLEGAPSWPHVWTGLGALPYPPAYHIVLRWWMDLFGESDLATRGLSAVCSLLCIVVLFDAIRRSSGVAAGLAAALVMAMAVSQTEMSHEARNYTLTLLLGMLACHAVVRIEQYGATMGRLLQLGLIVAGTLLTHYFAIFSIAGIGLYALRLPGKMRGRIIVTIVIAVMLSAAVWGPWFWQQHKNGVFDKANNPWQQEESISIAGLTFQAVRTPSLHLFDNASALLAVGMAMVVFVVPLVLIRRSPQRLLWWYWAAGTVGCLLAWDSARQTQLIDFSRFSFLATGAFCALAAGPLPTKGWRAWVIPVAVMAGVTIAAIGDLLSQSAPRWPMAPVRGEMRELSRWVDQRAQAHEPLIFYEPTFGAHLNYVWFAHEASASRRPVMILESPVDQNAIEQLANYNEVFLIMGNDMQGSIEQILPGWRIVESMSLVKTGVALRLVRDDR